MPRVEYSPSAGLVQRTGSGFALNAVTTTSGVTQLTSGTSVVIVGSAHAVTLPAEANTGDVIIAIASATGGSIASTNANVGATIDAIGDMAVCVYNGTQWIVGKSEG